MNTSFPCFTRRPILVFCRPALVEDFQANLTPVADQFSFEFLTDGVKDGIRDTRSAFYKALQTRMRSTELTAEEEADVVARCRLLRNLKPSQASRMAHAMAVALAAELDRVRPAAVLCQMVDEYVTHLLSLLAVKRGLRFVGYCWSYFPTRIQLTADAYGTPFSCREPSGNEVEEVLTEITQRAFRQNYNQSGIYRWRSHLYSLFRYRVKRLVFAVRARLERDRWNVHYVITPFIVERRRLRDFPFQAYFHLDWTSELAQLRRERPDAPVVYMPLGYFPESTIDYWVRDKRVLRYEALTLDIVRTLSRNCIVVVKEHIHMMGGRNASFLRALKAIPNIVSVHPMEFSNDVLAEADAVVLGGGSVGVEATIRGKPVFSFCETCYWFAGSGATRLDLGEIDQWSEQILAGIKAHRPLDAEARRQFIAQCLRSTTRTRSRGKVWPQMEAEDLSALLSELAKQHQRPPQIAALEASV